MGDRSIRYQPGLDGVRALAVSAVLLYHLGGTVRETVGRAGFLGVDIFFVLSGYLITTLLLDERFATGRIRLGAFWARRARRLLPALVVLLVLVAVLAQVAYRTSAAQWVRSDVPWILTFSQNWHLASFGGVLASPVSPMWSLSVEEQFYFVWPLVLLGLVTVLGPSRRRLFAVMVALVVVGGVWAGWRYAVAGGATYFTTDTRAPELFVGAALAVLGSGRGLAVGPRWERILDAVGAVTLVGLVVVLVFGSRGAHWYYGGFVLLAVATAVVITAAVQPVGVVRAVLSFPPLVAVGRISYGLYLFHLPVYVWIGSTASIPASVRPVLEIGASVVLAVLSFFLVEQPIRQRRVRAVTWVPAAGLAAALALVAISRIEPLPPTPRSPVLAFLLSRAVANAPPAVSRVLVVGGNRIAVFGLASRGPYRSGDRYGVAVGSAECGLLTGRTRCRAVPDDLAALSGTFDADTVVLVPDEHDLSTYSAGALDVGARLRPLGDAVPGRRVVVVRLPCGSTPAEDRSRFDAALTRWARRHHVTAIDSPFVRCPAGRPVAVPVPEVWAALGAWAG